MVQALDQEKSNTVAVCSYCSKDVSFVNVEETVLTSHTTGFDLMTCDSYFMIQVEVFTNHILAENIFQESQKVNRLQKYGLKTSKQIPNF